MKRKIVPILLAVVMVLAVLIPGCSQDSEEDIEGMAISSLKTVPEDFTGLLEKGIEDTNEVNEFMLQFPEELKEPYLEFLNTAFSSIEFEVSSIDEDEDGNYSARISFVPLDLQEVLETETDSFMETMQTTELTEEVSALLEKDAEALKNSPERSGKKAVDIKVKKEDSYSISKEDIQKLIEESLKYYMTPYESVCEVLDRRDFLQAYLDATFKGEFTQFMKYTGKTQEEARNWYEGEGMFDPPEDLEEQYRERCIEAYKNIFKQCKYQVGIPRKNEGLYNYTIDVAVTPNLSLENAVNEFTGGTYYDMSSASAALVESMEKYVASPSYGEEKTIAVELTLSSMQTTDETSDIYMLVSEICPMPE